MKELVWAGPGFYVALNFGLVQRWVLVNNNRACNAQDDWSWFATQESAEFWLGIREPQPTNSRKDNVY